jgi:cyclohexanecarboxylate-CoA ligase
MTLHPARHRPEDPPAAVSPAALAEVPIGELVRRSARRRPDAPAVVDVGVDGEERVWTWHDLDRQADAAAMMLLGMGVAPGEPVALQLPNCGEFVVSSLAVLRIGAVCCPLMPIFREREMAFTLRRAGARVLVVANRFRGRDYPVEIASLLAGAFGDPPSLEHIVVVGGEDRSPDDGEPGRLGRPLAEPGRLGRPLAEPGRLGRSPAEPRWHRFAGALAAREPDVAAVRARAPEPTALAQLLFTSGTSGEPKGVLQRMDALTRATAMEIGHLGLDDTDRIFIPSPLAHQTGFLYGMWLALVLGVPQILQPAWDGPTALGALRKWNGTFVQAATPFLSDLVRAAEDSGERPEALRIFVATGTTVPRALAERATRVLGTAVCGAWGSTETCLGSLSAPGDEPVKVWGTDGRALAGVGLRVTDDDGQVLPAGAEGNFEVSSACLFKGYLGHPEWTAEAMTADGWYRSGDLAVIDEAGYVRISGRVKDVINRGGEKVPVADVEQLLHTHPAVTEVAVVGMPDERLGERACAFVVTVPGSDHSAGFDLAEMQRFLDGQRMAKQYWPERLEVVAELPRNPAGKVQKFVLRQQARELVEREL